MYLRFSFDYKIWGFVYKILHATAQSIKVVFIPFYAICIPFYMVVDLFVEVFTDDSCLGGWWFLFMYLGFLCCLYSFLFPFTDDLRMFWLDDLMIWVVDDLMIGCLVCWDVIFLFMLGFVVFFCNFDFRNWSLINRIWLICSYLLYLGLINWSYLGFIWVVKFEQMRLLYVSKWSNSYVSNSYVIWSNSWINICFFWQNIKHICCLNWNNFTWILTYVWFTEDIC